MSLIRSSIYKPLGIKFIIIYVILLHVVGIAFHYFLLQLLLWWLCHITAVFQGTLFPLHTKGLQSRKKLKYIHVTMFILGWVLPVGPTAIIAHTGITLTRSPIILCTGHNANAIFGAMVVPISIVIASGATMLVFILWTVIKVGMGFIYLREGRGVLIFMLWTGFLELNSLQFVLAR